MDTEVVSAIIRRGDDHSVPPAELVTPVTPTSGAEPAWHLYPVRHPRAGELAGALAERGVQARVYYGTPLHRQPAPACLTLNATNQFSFVSPLMVRRIS